MRWLRVFASTVGLGLVTACALASFAGALAAPASASAAAAAAARYRSGNLHAQLVSHVAPGSSSITAGLSLTAANVTATVVGALALLSLAFVVVTLSRRRITT